jgi:hypothetical protein
MGKGEKMHSLRSLFVAGVILLTCSRAGAGDCCFRCPTARIITVPAAPVYAAAPVTYAAPAVVAAPPPVPYAALPVPYAAPAVYAAPQPVTYAPPVTYAAPAAAPCTTSTVASTAALASQLAAARAGHEAELRMTQAILSGMTRGLDGGPMATVADPGTPESEFLALRARVAALERAVGRIEERLKKLPPPE